MTQITLAPAPLDVLLQSDPALTSFHTTRQYKSNILSFEFWRAGREITKTLVEAYAAHMQKQELATRTINQHLASIRWFARRSIELAKDYTQTDPDQLERIARVLTVKDVKGDSDQRGRHIDPWEIESLLEACSRDKIKTTGARDAALIAIARATGLRRDSLSAIRLSDLVNPTADSIDLKYTGKGKKKNTAYITGGARSALLDWLQIRGSAPGYLFNPIDKHGNIGKPSRKMSGESLRLILEKRSLLAGLPEPITWHDFRYTFADILLSAGKDLVTVKELMSHSSIQTTAGYDRRKESTRREAVRVIDVPYKPSAPDSPLPADP